MSDNGVNELSPSQRSDVNIDEMHFLIALDDPLQRDGLQAFLVRLGATRITQAVDGPSALRVFNNPVLQIDIALVDFGTAGIDGMELIRHMAKVASDTAIILLGAVDVALEFSVGTLSSAYGIALLGFMQKSDGIDELDATIKRYVPRKKMPEDSVAPALAFDIDTILQALAGGDIVPYFQPKVDLISGQVVGAEAFARWNHPQYGVLSPTLFIPVLERHHRLDELTHHMIDRSAAACRQWHDAGHLISVSINLGTATLTGARSTETIVAQVAEYGLDPSFVVFEITESAANRESPETLESIVRLRMKGFALSIDDYGTGNASMQQLLRIPFSELKIDRSFVAGASDNETLATVLRSSLELAGKLDKLSVAVGIESRQDWDFLKKIGCTYGQGFYIAKPMAAAALPDWMREWAEFF